MKIVTLGKREIAMSLSAVLVIAAMFFFVPHGINAVSAMALNRKLPIYSVQTDKKQIALTFDLAWGNSDIDELIEILSECSVKATFFMTGEWVSKYPNDVLKLYENGHDIANHSDKHKHVNSMTDEELSQDIDSCNEKIKALLNFAPSLFRGPYGEYNNALLKVVEQKKMYAVQWNLDSRDWQGRSSEYIVNSLEKHAENGGIILMHNERENSRNALKPLISALKSKEFEFVLVKDLIIKENYYIDPHGKQCKM